MNYIKSIFIGLTGLILLSGCTQTHYDKGMYAYEHMAYKKASKHFKQYLQKKAEDHNSRIFLGKSYLKLKAYEKAEAEYAKALEKEVPGLSPIFKFEYAQLLATNGKKEEAKKWAKLYLRDVPDDLQAEDFLKGLGELEQKEIELKKLALNGFTAAFSAIPHQDVIYFVGEQKAKAGKKKNPWNGNSFLNIYQTDEKAAKPVAAAFNHKLHDGPFAINAAGDKVWVSRSASDEKSKALADDADVNQMYIYQLEKNGDSWTLSDLATGINKMGYSSMHPSLSPDGKKLFFVSDRPGGEGEFDLYVSELAGDRWSIPSSLGRYVNSKANEGFPFAATEDSLYFASDRAGGQGGMDIYLSVHTNGQWGEAELLAAPFNSSADDFAYWATDNRQQGYFSSNRDKKDQIYSWNIKAEIPEPPVEEVVDTVEEVPPLVEEVVELSFSVKGTVVNKKTRAKLPQIKVQLKNAKGKVLKEVQTDEEGSFKFDLAENEVYELHAKSKNSFSRDKSVNTVDLETSKVFNVELEIEVVEEKTTVNLNNIYYDYNAANLRDDAKDELRNLILFMKDNPGVKIQINAHTDSKGADDANLKLSQERAKSVRQFLVDAGIHADRISAKGYGETKLVNGCDDGVDCTEEQHQANRRTEFTILKLD
jgi:outer membrane protein OmpA-like peptidoglycan-associated protein